MNILQLTPGTGSFYCGSCLRDNDLAAALLRAGHDAQIFPLYLPFMLEEGPQETPVHMGGINMYLQQVAPWLPRLPRFLAKALDAPRLLRWASRRPGMTDPSGLGAMTLSMLRGEEGRQARELDDLIGWVRELERPDVVLLSNVMLIGLARRLKEALGCPVVCTLQGEAPFLDSLPAKDSSACWETLRERGQDISQFIAVSRYTASLMGERMSIDPSRMQVVPNGIDVRDFGAAESAPERPTIGYLARMCADKGLPELVDAFLELRSRASIPGLRLLAGGVVLGEDEALLTDLRGRVRAAGAEADVEFRANMTRAQKIDLLRSLTVLSVPARYGESFGLYLLEAMACGVPVVQPDMHGFSEVVEATGGGLLYDPDSPLGLADKLEALLGNPKQLAELRRSGLEAVRDNFNADQMGQQVASVCRMAASAGRVGA
ncbi:MAG: glycosyltransferase involved in cell wall biosynthesis [Planctomycetota bacterium]|jgi:glycosyltransferase involved in cell wall biosynthesis